MVKVAIVGSESTGKTTLATGLESALVAQGLCAVVVPEYARIFFANRPDESSLSIVEAIARGQLDLERQAACTADILLCDTTVLNCKLWSQIVCNEVDGALMDSLCRPQDYAVTFLMVPDIPWVPDGLRSQPNNRQAWFEAFKAELVDYGVHPIEIAGSPTLRIQTALQALQTLLPTLGIKA